MSGFGFSRDVSNGELDIEVAGTTSLTLTTTDLKLPVSTITYGGRGTATQGSNHSTGVTVDATSGTITLFSVDLTVTNEAVFRVTNSFVGVGDVVVVNVQTDGDAGTPVVGIAEVGAGFFDIILISVAAAAASFNGATTLNFAVIKTAT